jgi:hypothetical protein
VSGCVVADFGEVVLLVGAANKATQHLCMISDSGRRGRGRGCGSVDVCLAAWIFAGCQA